MSQIVPFTGERIGISVEPKCKGHAGYVGGAIRSRFSNQLEEPFVIGEFRFGAFRQMSFDMGANIVPRDLMQKFTECHYRVIGYETKIALCDPKS